MSDHTNKADEVEAEIDELAQESARLETEIGDTRADWERRKADEKVPGADDGGVDPASGSEEREGPPPEAGH